MIELSQWIEKQDIDQEVAIRTWLGLKTSRRILWLKARRFREILVDDFPAVSVPAFYYEDRSEEDREILKEWALNQSDELRTLTLLFLDSPTDEMADTIINLLPNRLKEKKRSNRLQRGKTSLTDLIISSLRNSEKTKDELYNMARSFLVTSKRPEAAVRQTLRVLSKKGLVSVDRSGMVKLNS